MFKGMFSHQGGCRTTTISIARHRICKNLAAQNKRNTCSCGVVFSYGRTLIHPVCAHTFSPENLELRKLIEAG